MDDISLGSPADRVRLLRSPWDSQLAALLATSEASLLFASPFITRSAANWLGEQLTRVRSSATFQILCLTNFRVESVLSGSLELEGLVDLGRAFQRLKVIHLPALHAKVFIADCKCAIVTSGNLTHGGLKHNCEYGIAIKSPMLVQEIRHDFEGYAGLGAQLQLDEIDSLTQELAGLRAEYQFHERKALKTVGKAFRNRLHKVEDRVLSIRARGNSNHAIFCNTIRYLLSKGPLSTTELHPLIQQIHPDLCDDGIDRIINGVHFGKKWKHLVRNAQQALKRSGQISYDGTRWRLTDEV